MQMLIPLQEVSLGLVLSAIVASSAEYVYRGGGYLGSRLINYLAKRDMKNHGYQIGFDENGIITRNPLEGSFYHRS